MATQRIKRSTIRMLHVPFSLLREKEIDPDILSVLARRYGLPDHLAKVLRGKRFRTPSDILRDGEIREAASPLEFVKLSVSPKHGLAPVDMGDRLVSIRATRAEGTELAVHLWTTTGDDHRLVLSSSDSELISVGLDGKGEIDPATIRLGGFWWWEWLKLGREAKELIYRRLVEDRVQSDLLTLARMSPDAQPHFDSLVAPIRKVAQLMVFFQSAIGTDKAAESVVTGGPTYPNLETEDVYDPGGMDPEDFPYSDKCSYSPDWPFASCCVAHDYCYRENARGCDECARLECDLDFLKCMLKIAGSNVALQQMAYVYFMGVRAFGDVGDNTFQYCSSSKGDGGVNLNKVLVVGALGVGVAVGTTVGSAVGVELGVVAGVGTTAALVGIIGRLMCEMCAELEEWVEKCEADRIKREERCKKRKRRCKKKKWWKKVGCYVKYFWHCVVVDTILKGACWLVKKVRPALC